MTENEQKESDLKFYRKGSEDGERKAKGKIAIQLVNIYYDTSYKWFDRRWRRDAGLKEYIDRLWNEFGPTYDDGDE